jgi:hypothetical protein
MHLTHHSQIRMQQRGIPILVVDWLLDYGVRERANHGAEMCFFDRGAKKRLRRDFGKQVVDRLSDLLKKAYLIVDGDTVITTGYITKHIRRS